MPRGNGTGPLGQGPVGGIGRGMGRGRGAGPGGFCVCAGCGTRVPHQPGMPCSTLKCPKCGLRMTRE